VIDANVLSRTVLDAVPGLSSWIANDAGTNLHLPAGPGPEASLPVPAVAEEAAPNSLAMSDVDAEAQAKRQQMRMFLYAIGGVGTVVGAFVLIAALASRSPASKRPQGDPPPDGPHVNWQLRKDLEAQRERDSHANRDDEAEPSIPGRGGQDWPPVQTTPATDKGDGTARPRLKPFTGTAPWEKQPNKASTGRSTPPKDEPPIDPPPGTNPGDTKSSTSQSTEREKVLEEALGLVKQLDLKDSEALQLKALDELGKKGPAVKDVAGRAVAKCMLGNPEIGRKALEALEKIDPSVAKECHAIVIIDPDHCLASIQSLERLGKDAKSATPILIHVAAKLAPRIGPEATKPSEVAAAAIRALAAIAPEEKGLARQFAKWMDTPNKLVKFETVAALPRLKLTKDDKERAVPALVKQLKGAPWEEVRVAAADTLGEFGPDAKDAVEALKTTYADDKKESVRQSAKQALTKIRGEQ
jgi:hypothetical protein